MSRSIRGGLAASAAAALAVCILAGFAVVPAAAAPANAVRTGTVESSGQSDLLVRINRARASAGLKALRSESRLAGLAENRARWMADRNRLSHTTYGGDIGPAVDSTGLEWLLVGEAVAMSSSVPAAEIGPRLFDLWQGSPPHWDLIVSPEFNYIGVGIGLAPNGDPYGALVFAEMADQTAPTSAVTSGSASGRTVTWRWSGSDVALQTHTAGLCTFDVQYRDGAGAWRLLKSRTTSKALALSGRTAGHTYALRVRARDCRGNLSAWTTPSAVRVG